MRRPLQQELTLNYSKWVNIENVSQEGVANLDDTAILVAKIACSDYVDLFSPHCFPAHPHPLFMHVQIVEQAVEFYSHLASSNAREVQLAVDSLQENEL